MFFISFIFLLSFDSFSAAGLDKQAIVDLHNQLRNGAQPAPSNMKQLQWNDNLAQAAQTVADSCYYEHHNPEYLKRMKAPDGTLLENVGQNLAIGKHSKTLA